MPILDTASIQQMKSNQQMKCKIELKILKALEEWFSLKENQNLSTGDCLYLF